MPESNLYQDAAVFCQQCAPRLAGMLAATGQGRPPAPGELSRLRVRAQDLARSLAQILGLEEDPEAAAQANPEGLALWERLLEICLGLTSLGLELARSWGPAYLPSAEDGS